MKNVRQPMGRRTPCSTHHALHSRYPGSLFDQNREVSQVDRPGSTRPIDFKLSRTQNWKQSLSGQEIRFQAHIFADGTRLSRRLKVNFKEVDLYDWVTESADQITLSPKVKYDTGVYFFTHYISITE